MPEALRKEMTLCDYLAKMPNDQVEQVAHHSDELLMNALKKRIGQRGCDFDR